MMRAPSFVLALLIVSVSGCGTSQPKSGTNSGAAKRPTETVVDGPGAALARAVRQVGQQCKQVSATHKWTGMQMSDCGAEVDWKPVTLACKDLRWEVTIGTLCRLAGDAKPAVRAVARARLVTVAGDPQVDVFDENKRLLVQCYAQRLKDTRAADEARYWAPMLVGLAAKLGVLAPHLPLVAARKEDDLRAAAYEQIWSEGRGRYAATVKRLLASEKPVVRLAILGGMRFIPKSDRQVACPLLRSLINDKDVKVAGSAAIHLVINCAGARQEVVAAARKHLQRRALSKAVVGSTIVAARDYTKGQGHSHPDFRKLPPKALKAQVVRWLVRVVGLKWVAGDARAQALSGLTFLDPAQAKQLARRHRSHPDPELRNQARKIVP